MRESTSFYTHNPEANLSQKEAPLKETRENYIGNEMEAMLFGTALSTFNYATPLSREDRRNNSPYEQYRSFLSMHAKDPVLKKISQESGHGTIVIKKYIAIAQALGIYSPEKGMSFDTAPKRPPLPQFARLIETTLNLRKDTGDQPFLFIPTPNTPLDFDYGTDAMVISASTPADFREIIHETAPYVSVGLTSFNKKEHEKHTGKKEVHSDVEIFIPSNKRFVDKLANSLHEGKIDPLVLKILVTITDALSQTYKNKLLHQKIMPQWINCEEIALEFEKQSITAQN